VTEEEGAGHWQAVELMGAYLLTASAASVPAL
jgi:hypothetical protein